jgi:hypothetical protein
MLFALARSVLWASVQPGWIGPDEDYHYLYVNYMVEKGNVPDLNGPFYTEEITQAVSVLDQRLYLARPRRNYSGGPHSMLTKLGGSRTPAPPGPRSVLHPPAYYLPDVLIDNVLWHKDALTRLTGMRYYNALLGALTIFFTWLLAAQVLAREWQQLAAAAVASLQPILAFSAATMTNDAGVAVMLTATVAWCAWMLRGPPDRRQGIVLGALFAIAILVKATMLSLVIILATMLMILFLRFPAARGELKRIVAWTVAIPLVVAGWWYVHLVSVTGSVLGDKGGGVGLASAAGPHPQSPQWGQIPSVAWHWLANVYRGYWFDYLVYEVHTGTIWFWLPAIGSTIVAAGIVLLIRDAIRSPAGRGPQLQTAGLLALSAILLLLPPWVLDTYRGIQGLSFITQQGRFLTPAYPGLAVLAVLALGQLTAGRRRAFPIATGILLVAAFVFYWHTWIVFVLRRFYGPIGGHWLRAFYHASFDKPAFITQTVLFAMAVVAIVAFVAAFVTTIIGSRRRSRPARVAMAIEAA